MSRIIQSFLTFLIGAGIFVLFPLVSWGLAEFQGFFGNPARVLYIILVIILNSIASWQMSAIPVEHKNKATHEKKLSGSLFILQVLSLLLVLIPPFFDRRDLFLLGSTDYPRFIGLLLYGFGFVLMHYVQIFMGRFFSVEITIQENHQLIKNGPFSYVRHPRYLGIVIFSLGIALIFNSLAGIIISLLIFFTLKRRISAEEKILAEKFGDEWTKYAKKTPGFIPKIF